MPIELKDYEDTIKSLVWKFRNLGFADMLYAPVIDTGSEAIAETKMANVAEGSEEKKSFRFTVTNFEDLISEGYVVFTELKNQFESGQLNENLTFEQALVKRLESKFIMLYRTMVSQKHTASVRSLMDEDGETILNLSRSFYDKLHYDYLHKNIPENLMPLAKGILNGTITDGIRGGITKDSLEKYLAQFGWKRKEIRRIWKDKNV
jgi:hypothetical protein